MYISMWYTTQFLWPWKYFFILCNCGTFELNIVESSCCWSCTGVAICASVKLTGLALNFSTLVDNCMKVSCKIRIRSTNQKLLIVVGLPATAFLQISLAILQFLSVGTTEWTDHELQSFVLHITSCTRLSVLTLGKLTSWLRDLISASSIVGSIFCRKWVQMQHHYLN